MSVYNFNDNEHTLSSNLESGRNSIGNGIQQPGYQQMENEFLSRNLNTTPNHNDSSVQLTRPTSKTALLVRQRRAMLEQLSCSICKGYLIDATTVDECMDSFCKSCIVVYLADHNDCPKCGAIIQHQNPFDAIRPDKVLQEIVYKLIPGLFDDEMRRRRDFYKEHFGATASSSDDDGDSSSGLLTIQGSSLSGERYGIITHPKPFYKPSDSIDLSIEPQTRGDNTTIYYDNKRQSIVTCFTGSLQQRDLNNGGSIFSSVDSQLFKTYLRCPARLTVLQLKKFIAAKFNICRDDTIHLLYLNESLKDEYSLIDVAYIYDWRGIEHMQLFYIIERDLSSISISNDQKQDGQRRAGKRQSVGMSTQTVKRVCIDPQPKFYDEKNNNIVDSINTEGRSMRPRNESPMSLSKTSQVTQTNPIIKISRDYSMAPIPSSTNGVSTRERSQASRQLPVKNNQDVTRKVEVMESRSLRSHVPGATRTPVTCTSSPLPKMDISRVSPSRSVDRIGNSSVSRNIDRNVASIPTVKSVTQIVPYTGSTRFKAVATTTQSSLVTLASFTEARSNHVVATMSSNSSTSTAFTNSQCGLFNASNTSFNSSIKGNQAHKFQSTPQLAFSFVTERGITIVRRINSQDHSVNSAPTLTVGGSTLTRSNASDPPAIEMNPVSPTRNVSSHGEAQPSSSRRVSDEGSSPRHQNKVKPVYKTFVDPTKLKSPNFKKLGFTARH